MTLNNIKTLKKDRGFTIVELLIVIVVIAILAAITIVAFNGIQDRAKTTAGKSLAGQVTKKVAVWNTVESFYPTHAQLTSNKKDAADTTFTGPTEAKLDNAASVLEATGVDAADAVITAETADGGQVTSYYKCASTKGGVVWYWDYVAGQAEKLEVGDVTDCETAPAV